MPRPTKTAAQTAGVRRRRRSAALLLVGIAGFTLAALTGLAFAKSLTLNVAKNAKVTNQSGVTKREAIAVDSHGFAIYFLTGDSKRHPGCIGGCFKAWPPVTVHSAKKLTRQLGLKGKLGTWRRDGFLQATLGGHPLYTFVPDKPNKHDATGEGFKFPHGTWHVVTASSSKGTNTTPMSTTTPSTTTTTTTPYGY